jgi:YidC/Oxa1 family membrane protein insertase
LRRTYEVVPNYGVAIILLTFMLRLVMGPLTHKQMKVMKKNSTQMAVLQPKIKDIQARYPDDAQKRNEETMKIYREAGVNPLTMMGGGCLPMLLQLPIFIGLYYALQSAIELRGAPFGLWITDLSVPETLLTIPGLEIPIRVLPLAMGASMVIQQKMTPMTSMDPNQARMMMTVMPIMFTVLFYGFPSGLVLYWFVSNLLGMAQQLLINRHAK